jgi:aryl-alcohol dehydrogenase-like predicted oxidoreductase
MPDLVFGTGGRFGRLSGTLATRLVFFAIDHGIRSFDTGYEYSSRRSQPLLFDILRSCNNDLLNSFEISTKFPAPQAPGHLTAYVNRSLAQLSRRDYLDTIFLWGPALTDLQNDFLFSELSALKRSGKILGWGVNTHCINVMSGILTGSYPMPVEHILLDYNMLQQDRGPLIKNFCMNGVKVWAGTVLCQGFLTQSLASMFLRTRSISYLMRALLQPSTRRLLKPARILREYLNTCYSHESASFPLAFVAANPSVSKIPVGMLSTSSILSNLSVLHNPPDINLIRDASEWAFCHCNV